MMVCYIGAQPPDVVEYSSPTSNLPVSDGVYNSLKTKERPPNLIEFEENTVYDNGEGNVYDNSEKGKFPFKIIIVMNF